MKNLINITIPRRTALKGLGFFTAFGLVTACGGGSMESTNSNVPPEPSQSRECLILPL